MRAATRLLTAWAAAAAVLLAALAPAHALAGRASAALRSTVCVAEGTQRSAAGRDVPGERSKAEHPHAHCPYCSLHEQALGLPPAPPAVAVATLARHAEPGADPAALRLARAWVSALPRAPPLRA